MSFSEMSDRALGYALRDARAELTREPFGPTARSFQAIVAEIRERGPRLQFLLRSFNEQEVHLSG